MDSAIWENNIKNPRKRILLKKKKETTKKGECDKGNTKRSKNS